MAEQSALRSILQELISNHGVELSKRPGTLWATFGDSLSILIDQSELELLQEYKDLYE